MGGLRHATPKRCILAQGELCLDIIVIFAIGTQHAAQMSFVEYDQLVEAFAADRAAEPLDVTILPWDRGAIGRS